MFADPLLDFVAYSWGVSEEGCLGPSRSALDAHVRWKSDRDQLPSRSLAAGLPKPCRAVGQAGVVPRIVTLSMRAVPHLY